MFGTIIIVITSVKNDDRNLPSFSDDGGGASPFWFFVFIRIFFRPYSRIHPIHVCLL